MSPLSGAPIDPTIYLSKTVSNVISSIVFGERFDYEDTEFLSLLQMMGQMNRFAASPTGQVTDPALPIVLIVSHIDHTNKGQGPP